MSVFELQGDLGPLDALDLRRSLDIATAGDRPQVVIDLSAVESMHPAVAAAVVRASRRIRRSAGSLELTMPTGDHAARMTSLISLPSLLR